MSDESKALFCPLRQTLSMVGGKWKLPILCLLGSHSPARYSTIKRKLEGITNMMLSQSLKELEGCGIVSRHQYNEIPPRVEYSLTPDGESLLPVLMQLAAWGAARQGGAEHCEAVCTACKEA